jgi:SnoaL-like domain
MTHYTAQQLADIEAIRAVLDEYCLRLEINTFAEWLDLFTPDAVYTVYGRDLAGHQAIEDMLSQAPHGLHMPGAARITLDGDGAETIQSYQFIGDDPKFSNTGWYHRKLVRTGAGWRIATCRVQFNRPDKKQA